MVSTWLIVAQLKRRCTLKSTLTGHASRRVSQRCSLNSKTIRKIIDSPNAIQVGQEQGNNKVHKLFWSIQDSQWFVAVQDCSDGEIITILPRCCSRWTISDDTLSLARKLALGEKVIEIPKDGDALLDSVFHNHSDEITQDKPNLYPSVYLRNPEGRIRIRGLGKLSSSVYGSDLILASKNTEVIQIILERAEAKKNPDETIESACLKLGRQRKKGGRE